MTPANGAVIRVWPNVFVASAADRRAVRSWNSRSSSSLSEDRAARRQRAGLLDLGLEPRDLLLGSRVARVEHHVVEDGEHSAGLDHVTFVGAHLDHDADRLRHEIGLGLALDDR